MTKKIFKISKPVIWISIVLLISLIIPLEVLATDDDGPVLQILEWAARWIRNIAAAAGAIFIAVAAFKFLIAGGDTNKIDEAKQSLLYALVGIVIAVSSHAIAEWLERQIKGVI